MVLDFKNSFILVEKIESLFLKLLPPKREGIFRKEQRIIRNGTKKILKIFQIFDLVCMTLLLLTYFSSNLSIFLISFLIYNLVYLFGYKYVNLLTRRIRANWNIAISGINKEYDTDIVYSYSTWAGNVFLQNTNFSRGIRVITFSFISLSVISVHKISQIDLNDDLVFVLTGQLLPTIFLVVGTLVNIFFVSKLLYFFGKSQSKLFENLISVSRCQNSENDIFKTTEYYKNENRTVNITTKINLSQTFVSMLTIFSPVLTVVIEKTYPEFSKYNSNDLGETLSLVFITFILFKFFSTFSNKALLDLDAINILTKLESELESVEKSHADGTKVIRKVGKNIDLSRKLIFEKLSESLEVQNLQPILKEGVFGRKYNFQLEPGEVLIVVGNSGTGKSTLLDAIYGERKFIGDTKLGSIDISKIGKSKFEMEKLVSRARNIPGDINIRTVFGYSLTSGFWSKNNLLKPYLSKESIEILDENKLPWVDVVWSGTDPGYKNIDLMKFLFNSKYKKYVNLAEILSADLDQAAIKYLKNIGFRNTENILTRSDFSHGETTLISVARTILPNISPILLVDEPEQGLDSELRTEMLNMIGKHINTPIIFEGKEFYQRAIVVIHNFTEQEKNLLQNQLQKKIKVLKIEGNKAFLD